MFAKNTFPTLCRLLFVTKIGYFTNKGLMIPPND